MARNRIGCPENISPADVDIEARRERRRKRPKTRKPEPLPDKLKPFIAEARGRAQERRCSPGVMLEPVADSDDWLATSPHDDQDGWESQIADAFGTRSLSTMKTFMGQFMDLCQRSYDFGNERWKPNERELNFLLNFVSGIQPETEVEAALAAQMAAVHMMTMRVSSQALKSGWMDGRDAAIAGKLARTFAIQLDALGRARGKSSTSRQTIEVHHHEHKHVHFEGGTPENGEQPYRAEGKSGAERSIEGTCQPTERAPLRLPDSSGNIVRLARDTGPDGLPNPRRQGRCA